MRRKKVIDTATQKLHNTSITNSKQSTKGKTHIHTKT